MTTPANVKLANLRRLLETDLKWPFASPPAREVQMEALRAGYGKPGFAYFLRQRLGKTWLAYAEFTLLRREKKCDWFFCICPNSLKYQWEEAIRQVDSATPVHVYAASKKAKYVDWIKRYRGKGGVIIINYESIKSFVANGYVADVETVRTYIVADESTKIKEPSNKTTKTCLKLAELCKYRRVLTGKPKANSNADLWAQLKFIGATKRNFTEHKYTFNVWGGWNCRTAVQDINNARLKTEMEGVSYIAPDKYLHGFFKSYEPMRSVPLLDEQRRLYDKMENDLLVELGNGAIITAPMALTRYLRLQQLSSGVAGDVDGVQHNAVRPDANPRIKIVKEILENEVENKCIIVCRFLLSIDNLFTELSRAGYKCAKFVGGMADIERVKRDFNDGDTDILIAQLQVLSFGHTLPGNEKKPCDSIIFYETDFSLINRAQCEARPEVMGRDVPISIFDLCSSKMDKYLLSCLRNKEDASMALMGYRRELGIFGSTARPTLV